jgi:uncharacterized membrane protein YhaH (DUF805 family)
MDWRDLYLSSRGRLDRQRYWLASLPLIGIQIVGEILIRSEGEQGLLVLSALLYLAVAIPSFIITVKRLHDRGRSGWFLSIAAIPVLGVVWLAIEVGLLPGARGPNRFGPDPLADAGARSAPSATASI